MSRQYIVFNSCLKFSYKVVHKFNKGYPILQTEVHEPYSELNGGQIIRRANIYLVEERCGFGHSLNRIVGVGRSKQTENVIAKIPHLRNKPQNIFVLKWCNLTAIRTKGEN